MRGWFRRHLRGLLTALSFNIQSLEEISLNRSALRSPVPERRSRAKLCRDLTASLINKTTNTGCVGRVVIFSRTLFPALLVFAFIRELSAAIVSLQTVSCCVHNQGHRVSPIWKSRTEAEPISSNCSDSSLRPALTVAAGQKLLGKKKKEGEEPFSLLGMSLVSYFIQGSLKPTRSDGYTMFFLLV